MKCESARALLDDYADGALAQELARELDTHLSACDACRAEADALRSLLEKAAALPKEIAPQQELWDGIASRIGAPKAFHRQNVRRKLGWTAAMMAAAALVLMLRIGYTPEMPGDSKEAGLSDEIHAAEQEYAAARKELLDTIASKTGGMDPDARKVIEDNLAVIDGAVQEIRSALDRDPDNIQLFRMLVATEQRNLKMIGRAVRLSMES